MSQKNTKKPLMIGVCAAVFFLGAGLLYVSQGKSSRTAVFRGTAEAQETVRETGQTKEEPSLTEQEGQTEETLIVYVCGAVETPGVYPLPADSRVGDAVSAAGGFAEDADREFLNLAAPVGDGEMVRVYTREETELLPAGSAVPAAFGMSADTRVDINSAGLEELMTLPGIGQVRAESILAWREENGRFDSPEDLMKVSGIGQGIYDRLSGKIRTGG